MFGALLLAGCPASAQTLTKLDSPVGTMQSDRVSSKCLDIVPGGGARADVMLKKCNGSATQKWFEQTVGPNYYKIISANKTVCFAVKATDPSQLAAETCADRKNQFFSFNAVKKQFRAAISSEVAGSGKCLSVKNSAKLDRLTMSKCSASTSQSWKLPG